MVRPARGEVWLTRLDPTEGSEIRKTRPCVIVSPERLSHHDIYMIAPLSSGDAKARFRVETVFQGRAGRVLPDQLRTVSRGRLLQRLGVLDVGDFDQVLGILRLMFEPD
ncbi:MAG: type II toxin-antitoxin system PemK/MazF family toxin [Alphaproteobacteria bacterium]|nr:type II toxin-antitoxin system PemK/MazF family toxin [Alphaproteobacteria bacterium]MBU1526226.1 type II toxin-antitoxin system PemK/MazF family toxin [Alphaproteobacteria bacterium]MBU2116437.1 type II toxin-antitoxin system PemK/MazF family toxin [Alphaproteobacteria bacterium]MBU2351383.1 type II toxin-antitoxin system PemK/MazF family toxin [Alphaproteobacteria bacterium]MBU2382095.1 type II toxin-antitoxin system PemK/MazF family toxin [Alphaproteobacteria bacterium]